MDSKTCQRQQPILLLLCWGFFLFLTFLCVIAKAIDIEGARETPNRCFKIDREVQLSPEFINSINGVPMFYPMMSRLDVNQCAADLLAPFPSKLINEGSMYYDGCIQFLVYPNGSMTSIGFNGRARDYESFPLPTGGARFQPTVGTGYSGTIYTTLTDQKTFAVFPACLDNNRGMTWCVLSTTPDLPQETKELIKGHVISLGFSEEYFTELRYGQCQQQQQQLPMPPLAYPQKLYQN